ncbi:hypothetical protein LIER_00584 [Lithospermum erythrorhizon]|uniref:Uncharacterized protein n=1 Tax=Lithospermum erythrorhizon TaxID=34254 RepID=A0AAV3NKE7_LITER
MLFTLNVEFNGKCHHSGSLESNGYVHHMLVSDVCGIIQAEGQRIGNSIFLEGIHPQTGTWLHLEDDDDVQHFLDLNFAIGIKEVKVKMANFTYTSLLEPLVSPGQDENLPSDGDEQFLFSDTSEENDKGDNQPSILICEFSESSGGVLSDYESENAENCIGIEELDDDKVGLTMGKQADKLQGSYFKFTTIKQGDKIKEVVKFAVDQVFENVDHFRSILRRKLYMAKEKGISLASGDYTGSYALIPRYGQTILDSNPQAWGCRPFIGLDGSFLKSPYGGQLLVAISPDANNGIFPIAVMAERPYKCNERKMSKFSSKTLCKALICEF